MDANNEKLLPQNRVRTLKTAPGEASGPAGVRQVEMGA